MIRFVAVTSSAQRAAKKGEKSGDHQPINRFNSSISVTSKRSNKEKTPHCSPLHPSSREPKRGKKPLLLLSFFYPVGPSKDSEPIPSRPGYQSRKGKNRKPIGKGGLHSPHPLYLLCDGGKGLEKEDESTSSTEVEEKGKRKDSF